MKEFVDELIERLEETDFNDIQMVVREVLLKYGFPYESIVQDEVWDALDELSSNKFAIKIINELAEEYNNGWIACSERLPETNESVLCWAKSTARGGDVCFVGSCHNGFWFLQSSADTHSFPGQYVIVAWQPLPQPYKENENGKI